MTNEEMMATLADLLGGKDEKFDASRLAAFSKLFSPEVFNPDARMLHVRSTVEPTEESKRREEEWDLQIKRHRDQMAYDLFRILLDTRFKEFHAGRPLIPHSDVFLDDLGPLAYRALDCFLETMRRDRAK